MSASDLKLAAQAVLGAEEEVLAAGIFELEDSLASLTKGSFAAAMTMPSDLSPVLNGVGNVAALEVARHKEAESKGLTERMMVAVTPGSVHLLALTRFGKDPERELMSLERSGLEVKVKRFGLSRKLFLTSRASGDTLKLIGTTVGHGDKAEGDKAVLETLT